jgi:protein-ribulosamine 3-kinase
LVIPNSTWRFIDYFDPVPNIVFEAYREITPIDPSFAERRELWRVFGYLAVVTVDGDKPFGRRILNRLVDAVRNYVKR